MIVETRSWQGCDDGVIATSVLSEESYEHNAGIRNCACQPSKMQTKNQARLPSGIQLTGGPIEISESREVEVRAKFN